jgi:4-amino-4-deoxy-L-arabinose transferase
MLLAGTFTMLLFTRVRQIGDLYDADQPKTMAYSVDMIRNHQWALPRDTQLEPATKPPMFNWLSIPSLLYAGQWQPWAFKLPSIIAAAATCALIVLACRRSSGIPGGTGMVAACIFITSYSAIKLMYFARPDMLLTAFLTGAWVSGTRAVTRAEGSTKGAALAFWVCVAGAALTKGPPALIPIVYVVIASRWIAGSWSTLRRLHWMMAIWVLALPVVAWMAFGFVQGGRRFLLVMARELEAHLFSSGATALVKRAWWQMPAWFLSRNQPWATLAVAGLIAVPVRQWTRHALAPAILWMLLVMALLCVSGSKRLDYLLPVYPAAAVLAAATLMAAGSFLKMTTTRALLAVMVYAVFLSLNPERRGVLSSDGIEDFATTIKPIINDDPMVVVGVAGYQPLLPLIGRFDGTIPMPTRNGLLPQQHEHLLEQIEHAKWAVLPLDENWQAQVASDEKKLIYTGDGVKPIRLGLYHIGDSHAPTTADLLGRLPTTSGTTLPATQESRPESKDESATDAP